jgi:hypothetical protein
MHTSFPSQHSRPACILVGFGLGLLVQGGLLLLTMIFLPSYIHYVASQKSHSYSNILVVVLMLLELGLAAEVFECLSTKFLRQIGIQPESGDDDGRRGLPSHRMGHGKDLDYYSLSKITAIQRESAETDIFSGAILGAMAVGVSYYSVFL